MSVSALKVVETSPAPPRRDNLARALAHRAETLARYKTASASVDRLMGLIAGEATAKAALVELEARSAAGAAAWANGATETLEIPSEKEVAAARREIAEASRLADAARAALPSINAQASAAAAAHSSTMGDIIVEIHQALYAEAAALRNEQLQHEKRAAECAEQLLSIVLAFAANPLPGDNRGQANIRYRSFVDGFVSPLRQRAEARLMPRADLAQPYIELARRLASDPTATLSA